MESKWYYQFLCLSAEGGLLEKHCVSMDINDLPDGDYLSCFLEEIVQSYWVRKLNSVGLDISAVLDISEMSQYVHISNL